MRGAKDSLAVKKKGLQMKGLGDATRFVDFLCRHKHLNTVPLASTQTLCPVEIRLQDEFMVGYHDLLSHTLPHPHSPHL